MAPRKTKKTAASAPVELSADAFMAAAKRRVTHDVYIPEMGATVTVRNLTAGEYDECVELATKQNPDGMSYVDRDLLHRLTVIAAIEAPKLDTAEAIEDVKEWDANIFARILLAIRELSGIREGAADKAMSRFPAGAA